MAAETQYTANTGMVKISTANSNLDGSGTLGTVLTGASNGTLIKTVTVKATGNTSQGMVRLFVYDGSNNRLLREIQVPPITASATDPSFEVAFKMDYILESGFVLKASTQNADPFNIVAEGLDFGYYASAVRPESTNYTANTGSVLVNAANTALDGSGTVGTNIFTALTAGAAGSGWKGCCINSITIKALGSTTHGMVRLFIQNTGTGASNTFLISETFIPYSIPSSVNPSYCRIILPYQKLQLQAGFKLLATSQNAENFSVIVDAMDWKYPS